MLDRVLFLWELIEGLLDSTRADGTIVIASDIRRRCLVNRESAVLIEQSAVVPTQRVCFECIAAFLTLLAAVGASIGLSRAGRRLKLLQGQLSLDLISV